MAAPFNNGAAGAGLAAPERAEKSEAPTAGTVRGFRNELQRREFDAGADRRQHRVRAVLTTAMFPWLWLHPAALPAALVAAALRAVARRKGGAA